MPLTRARIFAGSALALLLLTGCSGTDILNTLFVPHEGYRKISGISYGAEERQLLDIYLPEQKPYAGTIVFFYGGSWQKGNRSDYRFVGQALASRGYITVIPDYRLYPQVRFPAFLEDGAAAIAWVHSHAGGYGADANRLYLAGHSAGAYIAVMLALDDRYLEAQGGQTNWIRAVCGLAGPYDFLPFTDPAIRSIFSTAPEKATQPISYAAGGKPPLLLLTGDDDTEVEPKNSINLAQAIQARGGKAELKTYPDTAHIGIILSFAEGFRSKTTALDDMDHFFHMHE